MLDHHVPFLCENVTRNLQPSSRVLPDTHTVTVYWRDGKRTTHPLSTARAMLIVEYTTDPTTGFLSSVTIRSAEEGFPQGIARVDLVL